MISREDLRKEVPHGFSKIIAKKAGVTQISVSRYLRGHNNSQKIEMATLEVIAGLKKEKKILLKDIYE